MMNFEGSPSLFLNRRSTEIPGQALFDIILVITFQMFMKHMASKVPIIALPKNDFLLQWGEPYTAKYHVPAWTKAVTFRSFWCCFSILSFKTCFYGYKKGYHYRCSRKRFP